MPRRYRQLSNLDRARPLGQLQAGQSSRRVAMAFNTMQHLGMSRISHAQEDPGRRTVPRIDLSPTPCSETVLPMLQRRLGGFDNNGVLEAYPSLFKPSGTDSMLRSSPVFLLRSPVFLRGTGQLAFSLLVITSGGTGNSGERSRSQMRAGFVFDTLTGGYVSGVETGNVRQKSTCSHAMRIMEEASWSGQV